MGTGDTALTLIDLFFLTSFRVIRKKYELWRAGYHNALPWLLRANFVLLGLSYRHAWLTLRMWALSDYCNEKLQLQGGLIRQHQNVLSLELDLSDVKTGAELSVKLQTYIAKVYNYAHAYTELEELL